MGEKKYNIALSFEMTWSEKENFLAHHSGII